MQQDNSANNKRIAKNTVYLYVRMLFSMFISLYTSRAFLDALGVEDYGIYNIVAGFVTMLSIFTSSVTSAAQRFITFELGTGNQCRLTKTFSTISNLMILIAIVIVVIGGALGIWFLDNILVIPSERHQMACFVFYCALLAFAINLIAIPYTALVIAYEKMIFYALISIAESCCKLFIVWALYVTSLDRLGVYSVLLLLVGIIIRIAYGVYCRRKLFATKIQFKIDKGILKESSPIQYGLQLVRVQQYSKSRALMF